MRIKVRALDCSKSLLHAIVCQASAIFIIIDCKFIATYNCHPYQVVYTWLDELIQYVNILNQHTNVFLISRNYDNVCPRLFCPILVALKYFCFLGVFSLWTLSCWHYLQSAFTLTVSYVLVFNSCIYLSFSSHSC